MMPAASHSLPRELWSPWAGRAPSARTPTVIRRPIPTLVRWSALALAGSLPFEAADLGFTSSSFSFAKISGLLFIASYFFFYNPLSGKRSFPVCNLPLRYFLTYLLICLVHGLFVDSVYWGQYVSVISTTGQLLLLFWTTSSLLQNHQLARRFVLVYAVSAALLASAVLLELPGFTVAIEGRLGERITSLNYNQNTHTFSAVVKNQGTVATPVGKVIGVGYFVNGIQRTWGAVNTPLAAGASVTVGTSLIGVQSGPYTIPNGTHNIRAWVDDVNRFAESDEGNNHLTKTITIGSSSTTANVAPTISGTPATKVTKSTAYSFTPSATDTNGDTLTSAIQNKPAWATFNATTGRLSGTPTVLGTHSNIRISVTDGKSSAVFLPAFTIEVVGGVVVPPVSGGK